MSYLPIVAFAAPLGTDSAAYATAVGASGRVRWSRRILIATTLTAFESLMPLLGMAGSGVVDRYLGEWAAYIAGALLIGLGALMLRSGDDDGDETTEPGALLPLLGVALALSVDEVVVGASLGMAGVAALPLVATIAVWVFSATMSGLVLGAKIGDRFHDKASKAAALALIVLGVLVAAGVL